jgi:hexosaminidase
MLSSNLFINQTLVTLINKESKGDIYYTTDNSEPNLNSPKYTSAVEIKSEMTLKAKVILPNGIESVVVTGKYIPAQFIEPEKVDISKLKSGVKYNYYEGVISKMADFPTLSLKSSGIADKFEFPKTYDPLYFGLLLEGYIYIQQDGIYSFYTSSDDGSMLYVANELVVNNDESHGNQERSGQIALKAGYHKIKAMYFQSGGGMSFKVMMKAEKGDKIEISTSILVYL